MSISHKFSLVDFTAQSAKFEKLDSAKVAAVHERLNGDQTLLIDVCKVIGSVAVGLEQSAAHTDNSATLDTMLERSYKTHEAALQAMSSLNSILAANSSEWTQDQEPSPVTVSLAIDQIDQIAAAEQRATNG